ncbi:hypothetical protein TSUD_28160 [Trifolium subterraneum]|uniref:Peroxisomal membrane protein PMP22 n=1 Tax=Trifolium subterraneum TaxID=3900 RepID=A0A2Z6P9W3_TRISU|nr:hypothetical protein TSUD_28160 [Trifolium subterraneum]
MSDKVNDAWKKYLLQLQLHPLRTKAITSAVLAGFSDAVAQKISGVKKLQLRRLLLFMLYGFAYAGPFGHYLHKLMDYLFKGKKGNEAVAKKFWPIVGWVNYQYMPLQFRVLFHSIAGACWGIFLNLKARSVAIKKA